MNYAILALKAILFAYAMLVNFLSVYNADRPNGDRRNMTVGLVGSMITMAILLV